MPNVLKSLVLTLVAQAFAFASFLLVIDNVSNAITVDDIAMVSAIGAATIAAIALSWLSGLSLPWRLLNALFPGTLAALLVYELPGWFFLVAGVTIFALFLPALFSQVPYFPTSTATVEKLRGILPEDCAFIFIDLGCGFGEPLFSLARSHPKGSFVGIDLSPSSIVIAWLRSLFYANVKIRLANFWSHPLAQYDFVYAFLAPPPMPRLAEKARNEMKTSAVLISNTFEIPEAHSERIAVSDLKQHALFLYRWNTPHP